MDKTQAILDLVKIILPFFQSVFWGAVVVIIIFYFGPGIRDILASVHGMIRARGVKVTSSGIEIPPSIDLDKTQGGFLSHKSYYQSLIKQASLETLDEPLDDIVSHPKSLSKNSKKNVTQEGGLASDVQRAINSFVTKKDDKKTQTESLRNLLCDAYICLYFERAYQKLLGPQLHLLKRMSQSKDYSLTKSEVQRVLGMASTREENSDGPHISMDQWMDPLQHLHFIALKGNTAVLRDEGREFIGYIMDRDYSLKK